jgi:hypothetical protein
MSINKTKLLSVILDFYEEVYREVVESDIQFPETALDAEILEMRRSLNKDLQSNVVTRDTVCEMIRLSCQSLATDALLEAQDIGGDVRDAAQALAALPLGDPKWYFAVHKAVSQIDDVARAFARSSASPDDRAAMLLYISDIRALVKLCHEVRLCSPLFTLDGCKAQVQAIEDLRAEWRRWAVFLEY